MKINENYETIHVAQQETDEDSILNFYKKLIKIRKKTPVLINSDLIVTGSLYNTSDERLKNNITEINLEIANNLCELNPMHFTYKNDNTNKKHYGLLAQDIEKVFPELVENNNISYIDIMNNINLVEENK